MSLDVILSGLLAVDGSSPSPQGSCILRHGLYLLQRTDGEGGTSTICGEGGGEEREVGREKRRKGGRRGEGGGREGGGKT